MAATDGPLAKSEFHAMGTELTLLLPASRQGRRRLELAERWVRAYEDRLSRFIPYSELSRLNKAAGRPFRASPLLFEFVRACLDLAERSGGVFDPTLLHEVEAAGYDRSFGLIGYVEPPRQKRPPARRWSFRDVALDPLNRTITLPEGLGIDSGGLGKGWAADRMARILGAPCLVDAGGDIRVLGSPPDAQGWFVAVQDPFRPESDLGILTVAGRGVATSSVLKRRWPTDAGFAHHLIDARSGAPSDTDAVAATAIAETATLADFHAKVALLKGVRGGLEYLGSEPDVEGLIVERGGLIEKTGGLGAYELTPL